MFMIVLIGSAVILALKWDFSAKIVPLVVGTVALIAAAVSLFNEMCRRPDAAAIEGLVEQTQHEVEREDPHGSDLRHRTSAGARDHRARNLVLRLPDRVHGGDGGDRAHSDGRGVRACSSCATKRANAGRW